MVSSTKEGSLGLSKEDGLRGVGNIERLHNIVKSKKVSSYIVEIKDSLMPSACEPKPRKPAMFLYTGLLAFTSNNDEGTQAAIIETTNKSTMRTDHNHDEFPTGPGPNAWGWDRTRNGIRSNAQEQTNPLRRT